MYFCLYDMKKKEFLELQVSGHFKLPYESYRNKTQFGFIFLNVKQEICN